MDLFLKHTDSGSGFTLVEQPVVSKSKSNGFTLVELLVVIAIVALLASLLFPSLSKARPRGETVGCLSNLRQLGVLANSYSADNNGYMVMAFGGGSDSLGDAWVTAFAEELGGVSSEIQNVMHCPTQFKLMKTDRLIPTVYTYTENHQLNTEAFGQSRGPGSPAGPDDDDIPVRSNLDPVNYSAVVSLPGDSRFGRKPASPDTVAYFTDGWHLGPGSRFVSWRIWGHLSYYRDTGGPSALASAFPHDWKCNVLFMDGHVETTVYDEGMWEESLPANWSKSRYWTRHEGRFGRGRDHVRAF